MNDPQLEYLSWDSNFFGYPVGKIDIKEDIEISFYEFNQMLKNDHYKLIYIFSDPLIENHNHIISKTGAILINQRVEFSKIPNHHTKFLNPISEYTLNVVSSDLKSLALAAGKFSRFKTDNTFANNEFISLYEEWIKKSVNKEIARKIFVSNNAGSYTGLLTLNEVDGKANIGLLSVDDKYHGKHIATDLVYKAENDACNFGDKLITVRTQLQNTAAVNLYKKCGFNQDRIRNIYHFWNKNFNALKGKF